MGSFFFLLTDADSTPDIDTSVLDGGCRDTNEPL